MVKVVIVNGMPESGKTTFQERCRSKLREHRYMTIIKSSVEWVKIVAMYCGWDGTKTDKNRKFLSDLKRVLTEWDDAVLKNLVDDVNSYHYTGADYVIFIDIREPKEIERAKKVFNAMTTIVRRPQVECNCYSNNSDMEVFEYKYDYTIWNDSNLEALDTEIDRFINNMIVNNDNNIYKPEESYNE